MAHLACYQSCKRPSWGYSEQKNCLIKGQISLVRQITAQLTKVNPWEIIITKLDILSVAVLNNTHSASVVEFILTLQWDPSNPDHEIIMWLNLKHHAIWPSTVYRAPSVQLHLQQMCPVKHSAISLLCSKRVNLAIRWPLGWMSGALLSEGFTSMSAALPPGSMVVTRTGLCQWINPPP